MRAIDSTTKKDRDLEVTDNGLKVDGSSSPGGAIGSPSYVAPATGAVFPVVQSNPSSVARGSQAATGSAVALGGATTYTAGIFIWNSDTANYVTVGTGTPTDGAGANKIVLGPGQGYQEPTGDLSALKIIATTGSPVVNWIGMTK
jgi:hypothetical protein